MFGEALGYSGPFLGFNWWTWLAKLTLGLWGVREHNSEHKFQVYKLDTDGGRRKRGQMSGVASMYSDAIQGGCAEMI